LLSTVVGRNIHPRIIMTQQEKCGNILKIIKLKLLSMLIVKNK
jgi:hypothetical protein